MGKLPVDLPDGIAGDVCAESEGLTGIVPRMGGRPALAVRRDRFIFRKGDPHIKQQRFDGHEAGALNRQGTAVQAKPILHSRVAERKHDRTAMGGTQRTCRVRRKPRGRELHRRFLPGQAAAAPKRCRQHRSGQKALCPHGAFRGISLFAAVRRR